MARLNVRVQPGSSREDLRLESGLVRAKLTASPVDGKANQALIALLSKRLGVPKSSLRIIRGAASRDKLLEVAGMDQQDLERRVATACGS